MLQLKKKKSGEEDLSDKVILEPNSEGMMEEAQGFGGTGQHDGRSPAVTHQGRASDQAARRQ